MPGDATLAVGVRRLPGRQWNLVQDASWWAVDAMPLGGIKRHRGMMRPSVEMCVWLGPPDCYRKQDNVLMTPSSARLLAGLDCPKVIGIDKEAKYLRTARKRIEEG